jgi:hypothetical protein
VLSVKLAGDGSFAAANGLIIPATNRHKTAETVTSNNEMRLFILIPPQSVKNYQYI